VPRTTLTLDPDVARLLDEAVHEGRTTFKSVVNEAIRQGLRPRPSAPIPAYRVTPHACALVPGVDPRRMNQLADEFEVEAVVGPLRIRGG
jgi:hypothetical protein